MKPASGRLMARNRRCVVRRSVGVSILLIILLLLSAIRSQAEDNSIYGCVLRFLGILRIVDNPGDCIKNLETPISWSQVGQRGAPGDKGDKGVKGDQGPPGTGAVKLFDANDQFLGYFLGIYSDKGGRPYYQIFIPSTKLTTLISGDDIVSTGGHLYYDSTDCSGKAYLLDNSFFGFVKRTASDPRKYIILTENEPEHVPASFWDIDGSCQPFSPPSDRFDSSSWHEFILIPEANIPFHLPLAVPLRFDSR
jgi:hypothetical protein